VSIRKPRASHAVAALLLAGGLACATASGQTVGYFTDFNPGATGWEGPITDNGFVPVQVLDITTFDFSTVDIMVIDETSNGSISPELLGRAADLAAYVMGGGKLVYHDRYVTDNSMLPGGGAINLVRDFTFDADLDVVTPGTLVTEGPFGTIDDSTLDGGTSSNHGWAENLPAESVTILSAGPEPARAAGFSYLFDAGAVYYSSIPLDYYLAGSGPADVQAAMTQIYAPNLLAYMDALAGVVVTDRSLIIKQGACPAPVNPASNGLTKMLLVGEADFDVSQVVLESVELSRCDGMGEAVTPHFGPPGPGPKIVDLNHPNDDEVGCGGEAVPCACNDDQSSDGIDDLSLRFATSAMAEAFLLDEAPGGSIITLVLTGELADGSGFAAADCIQIVGPPAGDGALVVEASMPDVWIDMQPLDDLLDDGGFTTFKRGHGVGTLVTLTAPETVNGRIFVGWIIDGLQFSTPQTTVHFIVHEEETTAEALYTSPPFFQINHPDQAAH
jgi:hypothetical protein